MGGNISTFIYIPCGLFVKNLLKDIRIRFFDIRDGDVVNSTKHYTIKYLPKSFSAESTEHCDWVMLQLYYENYFPQREFSFMFFFKSIILYKPVGCL